MNKVWVYLFTALAGSNLMAKTLHVDLNSTNSIAPYSSRETAATDIQTAVNAAIDGDTVQVWYGHYLLASQISVSKDITIQGVNGPETTIVDGQGNVRCFNLGNNDCVVEGMTIMNGFSTGSGGGIYCSGTTPVVTNCTISGNLASDGGGMCRGTANNCTISRNSAEYGGGMYYGTANNCTLSGNTANYGAGMYRGTANNCTLSGNTASEDGGGMCKGTANNCTISENSSEDGGGIYNGTANNCILSGNTAYSSDGFGFGSGGGIYSGLANNCILSGNSAEYGGGMYGGTANNSILSGNSAKYGGGMKSVTANYCTLIDNTATQQGGGMYGGTANNCTISGNSARYYGGGMYGGTANNCTLSENHAFEGGGISGGTANNCTISGNAASSGGGIYDGSANNCTLSGNSASQYGGGMYDGTANNCVISGNSATRSGGGMSSGGMANNCIISGNSASQYGGGIYYGTANNCIIYYNSAVDGNDLQNTEASYSCSPNVVHGVNGNITNAPMLVSSSHIALDSPCWGAGSTNFLSGMDIDGEAWANPPSIGCDEPSDSPSGIIIVGIDAPTRQMAGYTTRLIGDIEGAISMHVWNFGDGSRVTNSVFVEHTWRATGTYDMILTAYNDDWPDGVSATQQIVIASEEDLAIYVSPDGDDAKDGTSWTSAKATIQVGVDAQNIVNGWVIVGAGFYPLSSTISISKPVRIVGADGPDATIVDGQGTVRCFNLGNSACILEGLTITNGYSSSGGSGGGIYCSGTTPVVTNCTLSGNTASSYGGGMYFGTANNCAISRNTAYNAGGGICRGTANNCTISGNKADLDGGGMNGGEANNCTISGNKAYDGGGMYSGTANNCIINGNTAYDGGGMFYGTANNCTISGNKAYLDGGGMRGGTANNCIVYGNTAPEGNDLYEATVYFSCSPDAAHGVDGNITNAPFFVDILDGDFRLMSNSPCINWGSDTYVEVYVDLDGQPRVVGNHVDMGAYEYQGPFSSDQDNDGLPDEWERDYFGFNPDPFGDDDSDILNNVGEYIAGTDPSDPNSMFVASVSTNQVSFDGFVIEWTSIEDRTYSVRWGRTLTNAYGVLEEGIEYPQNSYTDTVHNAESTGFYQIEVQLK